MITYSTAYFSLQKALLSKYEEGEASAIAHLVMEHLTGLSRMNRLVAKDQELGSEQELEFTKIKDNLLTGMPLQYALGYTSFLGNQFEVNHAVLIPRPETEELVEWIIDEVSSTVSILDIGTGSGCIPISLKMALPDANITGIDISTEALDVAIRNSDRLGTIVHFMELDFLTVSSWDRLLTYDVIVSNPPYIPFSERGSLDTNVAVFEPSIALFVPTNDALIFYKAIAQFGLTHLSIGGSIYCELHQDYAEQTVDLFRVMGYCDVQSRKDIHGAVRMLRARYN